MAVTITETTLASALRPEDSILTLAAASGAQPGHIAYIGRESVRLLALVALSTVAWNVARGQDGTPALSHIAGAKVKVGPVGYFGKYDRAGAADALKEVAVPWINVYSGNVFVVTANEWQQVGIGGVKQGAIAWP